MPLPNKKFTKLSFGTYIEKNYENGPCNLKKMSMYLTLTYDGKFGPWVYCSRDQEN